MCGLEGCSRECWLCVLRVCIEGVIESGLVDCGCIIVQFHT